MKNLSSQEKQVLTELVKATASEDKVAREQSRALFTKALEMPLRQGMFEGDILFDIFTKIEITDGCKTPEFPMDFVVPGTECDYMAYTIPSCGAIPHCCVEGDYIQVPTYEVGNCIDTCIKYIKNARWDVVSRMLEVFRAGFVMKLNRDAWHVLLASGVGRGIMVADNEAKQGQFTKRLLNLMMNVFQRNGGGNSTSLNRKMITDLYLSPEGMSDIRCWNTDQVDEMTRREIFTNNGQLSSLYGVNLHVLDELGVGQEFQNFVTNDLGVTLPTTGGNSIDPAHPDVELVVGLDQSDDNAFVMPVSGELEIFEDDNLHRMRRWGIYGWMEVGFAALDSRNIILGSY